MVLAGTLAARAWTAGIRRVAGPSHRSTSAGTLAELASAFNMPPQACARRYGQVTLPEHDRSWRFNAALGFTKRRYEAAGPLPTAARRRR